MKAKISREKRGHAVVVDEVMIESCRSRSRGQAVTLIHSITLLKQLANFIKYLSMMELRKYFSAYPRN